MTKPRLTRRGLLWTCRTPLCDGLGIGLTPADAYKNWLLDSQRPRFSLPEPPRLMPMHEPVAPWPQYWPPVFVRHDPQYGPPYTVTCRH